MPGNSSDVYTKQQRIAELAKERFNRLLKYYPLPPPRIVHSVYAR